MFWNHKWAFAHGPSFHPGCAWRRDKCHPSDGHPSDSHSHSRHRGSWHAGFGVRRPLRFLARQLDLDEDQAAELAAILDELKTQRAQADVDRRKAISVFADVFLGEKFDAERVRAATAARADSAQRVEEMVAQTLERTYTLLDRDQRKRLAYLLRSEGLTI